MKNKISNKAWILLNVEDFARSRNFYETVMEQEIAERFGSPVEEVQQLLNGDIT